MDHLSPLPEPNSSSKRFCSFDERVLCFDTKMPKKNRDPHARGSTHFLNVDLDIYSASNLEPLVSAMGKDVEVLFLGRIKRTYQAHLELAYSGLSDTPDPTIRDFCDLVRRLPRAARRLWNTAKKRDFNIGVQSATQPYSYEIAVEAETVKAVSELGARIVLTIYAHRRATMRRKA
jgi:hypothetical protein